MNTEELDSGKLHDYLIEDATEFMPPEEAFDLLLLLIDEKPGASITVHFQRLSNNFKEFIKDFSDEFNLHYIIQENSSQEDQAENFSGNTVFLTKDEQKLEMLKPLEDVSEKEIGLFLGYPDDAVEAFQSSTGFTEAYKQFEKEAAKEHVSEEGALEILEKASAKSYGELFQEKLEELKEEEVISKDEERYLDLVSYVPVLEQDDILEAISEGRRRKKLLEELDKKAEASVGKFFIEQIL